MKRVTVVMSTYNDEQHLEECLQSLANQTYPYFVVKLADDGSTDRTLDIIDKWCRSDSRFQLAVRHRSNQGLTVSLNELLRHVDTELIARMDADDYAMPHRIARQVEYMDNHDDVSVVGSWAIDVDGHGQEGALRKVPKSHEDIVRMILRVNPLIHPSVMFRREAIVKLGGYNEQYRYAQDYALWYRCIAGGLRLANIPEPLIRYRVNPNHVAKRGLKYRRLDASIRWNGARSIGYSRITALYAASIPILIGVIPRSMKRMAMKYRDYIDPRQKQSAMLQREERVQ